jgi:hypothetical protein
MSQAGGRPTTRARRIALAFGLHPISLQPLPRGSHRASTDIQSHDAFAVVVLSHSAIGIFLTIPSLLALSWELEIPPIDWQEGWPD